MDTQLLPVRGLCTIQCCCGHGRHTSDAGCVWVCLPAQTPSDSATDTSLCFAPWLMVLSDGTSNTGSAACLGCKLDHDYNRKPQALICHTCTAPSNTMRCQRSPAACLWPKMAEHSCSSLRSACCFVCKSDLVSNWHLMVWWVHQHCSAPVKQPNGTLQPQLTSAPDGAHQASPHDMQLHCSSGLCVPWQVPPQRGLQLAGATLQGRSEAPIAAGLQGAPLQGSCPAFACTGCVGVGSSPALACAGQAYPSGRPRLARARRTGVGSCSPAPAGAACVCSSSPAPAWCACVCSASPGSCGAALPALVCHSPPSSCGAAVPALVCCSPPSSCGAGPPPPDWPLCLQQLGQGSSRNQAAISAATSPCSRGSRSVGRSLRRCWSVHRCWGLPRLQLYGNRASPAQGLGCSTIIIPPGRLPLAGVCRCRLARASTLLLQALCTCLDCLHRAWRCFASTGGSRSGGCHHHARGNFGSLGGAADAVPGPGCSSGCSSCHVGSLRHGRPVRSLCPLWRCLCWRQGWIRRRLWRLWPKCPEGILLRIW